MHLTALNNTWSIEFKVQKLLVGMRTNEENGIVNEAKGLEGRGFKFFMTF